MWEELQANQRRRGGELSSSCQLWKIQSSRLRWVSKTSLRSCQKKNTHRQTLGKTKKWPINLLWTRSFNRNCKHPSCSLISKSLTNLTRRAYWLTLLNGIVNKTNRSSLKTKKSKVKKNLVNNFQGALPFQSRWRKNKNQCNQAWIMQAKVRNSHLSKGSKFSSHR